MKIFDTDARGEFGEPFTINLVKEIRENIDKNILADAWRCKNCKDVDEHISRCLTSEIL